MVYIMIRIRLKQWLRYISAACDTYINALCVIITWEHVGYI
jgi:hypothetical protein